MSGASGEAVERTYGVELGITLRCAVQSLGSSALDLCSAGELSATSSGTTTATARGLTPSLGGRGPAAIVCWMRWREGGGRKRALSFAL